jgi:pimeloyl-ACP methyl ester carboxylesterase
METLAECEKLRVRYQKGDTTTLVVSFTGVLHGMGDLPVDEFRGSTRGHHGLFISDLSCSWYNSAGTAERIVDLVQKTRSQINADKVVTIGNSMGGFGAILFARLVEANTAIAFAPQFSVKPDLIPSENRWRALVARIDEWRFPTPLPLRAKTHYFIFSGSEPCECEHARRFERARNVTKFIISGGHGVAQGLKDTGQLGASVRACIDLPAVEAKTTVARLLVDRIAHPSLRIHISKLLRRCLP